MPDHVTLQQAVIQTVSYADVFDFPLNAQEIHRYLVQCRAGRCAVERALNSADLIPGRLTSRNGYFMLPNREHLSDIRDRRARISANLWKPAQHYAAKIKSIPFVRMVALTGALAVGNADEDADIDYLIVTAPGRLWLCRAMAIILVRLARHSGIDICPNYFLTEDNLALEQRNLFTAREMTQMIPLYGHTIYFQMRALNSWAETYLPNASGPPIDGEPVEIRPGSVQRLAETALKSRAGSWLERWEMNRKIAKFERQQPTTDETLFGPKICQGHFEGYRQKTLRAYAARLSSQKREAEGGLDQSGL